MLCDSARHHWASCSWHFKPT